MRLDSLDKLVVETQPIISISYTDTDWPLFVRLVDELSADNENSFPVVTKALWILQNKLLIHSMFVSISFINIRVRYANIYARQPETAHSTLY